MRICSIILVLCAAGVSAGEGPSTQQHALLNALDAPSLPGMGAWEVDALTVTVTPGSEDRFGGAALEVSGQAKVAGGKVDIPLSDASLPGCNRLSLWVAPTAAGNVDRVGFQVRDAKGEWLMQSVPLDWSGWKRLDLDPSAGGMVQAYEQKDQDGKADLPLTSVHVIWFAKAPGPTALAIDCLSAGIAPAAEGRVTLSSPATTIVEPGRPLSLRLVAENRGPALQPVEIRYTLQANPEYIDTAVPDAVLGFDHAVGAVTTVSVDGVAKGDAKTCDGDVNTAFETSWGKGYGEAVVTIDMGTARDISAVRWLNGDANWIFKADLATSLDGTVFFPVEAAQGVDLHGKWGGTHAFPWPKPVRAQHLRFRFHNGGTTTNCIRLPPTIMVFDGIGNDVVTVPKVGAQVAAGTVSGQVPARDFAELTLAGTAPVGPGAYLLGLELAIAGNKEVRWSHVLVRPSDVVDQSRARRFGINGAEPQYAGELQRCGFGWMRFENAKWQMFMPTPDRVGLDGSVAPWHVNHEQYFQTYQKHGLSVLPYVFQPPEWATSAPAGMQKNRSGYPPKNNADYGEAIFQLVARFGGANVDPALLKTTDKKSGMKLIQAVELWNEPNLNDPGWGPFVGTLAQYYDVMRAGAEGSRRADPTLPVSAAGWAGLDLAVVGTLAEHRYADGKTPLDMVDIVNVHFYSGREEPETCGWDPNVDRNGPSAAGMTYTDQLEDLVAWRDQLKPKAEIWLTETGNDVGGPLGLGEREQAAKVPRAVMLALAAGLEKVFIYREKGSDPSMHAGAGLIRNDSSLRPQWFTVATMIRQLQGFGGRAMRLPSADPDVWMLLWQDGTRQLVTAWTTGKKARLGVELGKAQVVDAFGCTVAAASTIEQPIGYFPVYLTVGASPVLDRLVAEAKVRDAARLAERNRRAKATLGLFDFGPAAHVGTFRGYGLPRRFTPVGADGLWNEAKGYGFTKAPSEDDRRWIDDPLVRDGCRTDGSNVFRFKLPAGRYLVRVYAESGNEKGIGLRLTAAPAAVQELKTTDDKRLAEAQITVGEAPVELSLAEWGILRWLTAVPLAAE